MTNDLTNAVLSDGTINPNFVPERYGVVVTARNGNGERVTVSDTLLFDQSYGLNGQDGCVDVAERLQDFFSDVLGEACPVATVYASHAVMRDLLCEVGTVAPGASLAWPVHLEKY